MRGGGSSIALSSALPACSVSRSASSTSSTCQRPALGAPCARSTSARISATPMVSPSGTTNRTSAWVPAKRRVAGRAVAAAAVRALQRGGEGARRDRPARAGRPGEQPGVGHRRRPPRASSRLCGGTGRGEPPRRHESASGRRCPPVSRPPPAARSRHRRRRLIGSASAVRAAFGDGLGAAMRTHRRWSPRDGPAAAPATRSRTANGDHFDRRASRPPPGIAPGSAAARSRKACRTRWWKRATRPPAGPRRSRSATR